MEQITARSLLATPLGQVAICIANGKVVEVGFTQADNLPAFADSEADGELAEEAARQLSDYFAGGREHFDLPIAFSGTRFQQAVWKEIAKIGFGKTATYKDLALRIGKPKASRAVGGAVGANPIGIIVGCHRILGSSGQLTGYSGGNGVPTKIKLLELEGISFK
jgi:methylated-DNA-[protein]-cysteine S-methyltransferase